MLKLSSAVPLRKGDQKLFKVVIRSVLKKTAHFQTENDDVAMATPLPIQSEIDGRNTKKTLAL